MVGQEMLSFYGGTSIPGRVGISWEATKSLVSGDGNMI